MEMPKPTEAHRKLNKLVGTWTGEEKLHPSPWDPKGGMAVGRITNKAALDGFAVIQDYEQERDGAVTFRGHGIFTWDGGANEYVMYWFDSMGMPPNAYRGTFEGSTLSTSLKMPQGYSRAVFEFHDDNHYTFRMEMSGDGQQWQTFMEGKYARK